MAGSPPADPTTGSLRISSESDSELARCAGQVLSLAEAALAMVRIELQTIPTRDELALDEQWAQYIDHDERGVLTEEIMEERERRVSVATGQRSWQVSHQIPAAAERTEFFRELQGFYRNNRALFGALVTVPDSRREKCSLHIPVRRDPL